MKKMFSLLLVLMLCVNMSCTASATTFTASVENKSAPAVMETKDEEGNSVIAVLSGELPEEMENVSDVFLVVTAVADAEESDRIPDASEQALMEVYTGLQEGTIQVPFAQLDEEKADNLVIRDLFDISWTDVEGNNYEALLESEEVSLEMTFEMEVAADAKVYVMVYKNDTWNEIRQATNNGDGTITCVFEHLCPVAVIVEAEEAVEAFGQVTETAEAETVSPAEETSGQNMGLWIAVLVAAAAALVAVVARRRKK